MVIVDSSVIIDALAGRSTPQTIWLNQQLLLQRIGITSAIQMEVLQGIRDDKLFESTVQGLHVFEIFETGSSSLAIASAQNFRQLRKIGVTIRNSIDCLIATFCIQEGHLLLHNDRDYDAFERHLGLKVIHLPTLQLQ